MGESTVMIKSRIFEFLSSICSFEKAVEVSFKEDISEFHYVQSNGSFKHYARFDGKYREVLNERKSA